MALTHFLLSQRLPCESKIIAKYPRSVKQNFLVYKFSSSFKTKSLHMLRGNNFLLLEVVWKQRFPRNTFYSIVRNSFKLIYFKIKYKDKMKLKISQIFEPLFLKDHFQNNKKLNRSNLGKCTGSHYFFLVHKLTLGTKLNFTKIQS